MMRGSTLSKAVALRARSPTHGARIILVCERVSVWTCFQLHSCCSSVALHPILWSSRSTRPNETPSDADSDTVSVLSESVRLVRPYWWLSWSRGPRRWRVSLTCSDVCGRLSGKHSRAAQSHSEHSHADVCASRA